MTVLNGSRPALAITVGEPAGIGPEIAIRAAWALRAEANCVLVGDAAFLALTAGLIDPAIRLAALSIQALRNGGLPHFGQERLAVIDVPLAAHVVPGTLDADNGRAVLATLDLAIEGTGAGWFEGIVTAPLQKSTINDAGVAFSGHTEYLAEKTGTPKVVMMLAGQPGGDQPYLRVALATTHLALKDVPAALTRENLAQVIDIIHADLQAKFGIDAPRILVTGLNPHAGENGYLGREEIEVITPVLEAARARGIDARGPYPADTLFQPKYLQDADCVLAMYHDQGLPVLKHATFGRGINVTLGLPFVRTSVDHGTALDLAAQGLGLADCGSMIEAIRAAMQMAVSRRGHYSKYDLDQHNYTGERKLSRSLHTASLDAGLVFERETTLFGKGVTQTLEPRLFYVKTPYKDQSAFPVFDTGRTGFNYAQLFSENRYVGPDRVSDANQLTAAVVSRFIQQDGSERLRMAFGQRMYFDEPRVRLPGEPVHQSRSDVLVAAAGRISETWSFDSGVQYDATGSNLYSSNLSMQWQPARMKVLNAEYRYQRDSFRNVDLSGQWPLSKRWYGVARVSYALRAYTVGNATPGKGKLLESLLGLEYKADCWVFRFGAQRFVTAAQTTSTPIFFQLELNGLSALGLGSNPLEAFNKSVPGYTQLNTNVGRP